MSGESNYGPQACLERMAGRFDDSEVSGGGWGQFLDGPRDHPQVGPYGTSSGVIVRALAGRPQRATANGAVQKLIEMSRNRDLTDPMGQEYLKLFSQNLRLAYLVLALRLVGQATADMHREREQELLGRMLPGGGWGDWYANAEVRDENPRPFTTALVILCLCLFRSAPAANQNELTAAIRSSLDWLLRITEEIPDLSALRATAILAAARHSGEVGSYFNKKRLKVAQQRSGSTGDDELSVYFFDYSYVQNGQRQFGRDYFIVPMQVLRSIAAESPLARITERIDAAIAAKTFGRAEKATLRQSNTNPQPPQFLPLERYS